MSYSPTVYSASTVTPSGVEMLEDLAVADVDLSLLEHDGYRHDERELRELALIVVHHADDGLLLVPHQYHLRRPVEERRVGLADVEAAERAGVRRRCEPDERESEHRDEELQSIHGSLHFLSIRSEPRAR